VLPSDALPGKVTGVEVILEAVSEALTAGRSPTSVAASVGVAGRTLKSWILGLGARVLDLEQLYRHRARRAPSDAPPSATLHRWAAVSAELQRQLCITVSPVMTDLRGIAGDD
jgi:hypothetical protein